MDVITVVLLLSGIAFCTSEISLNNLESSSEISFIKDRFEDVCYQNGGKKAFNDFKLVQLQKMAFEECLERNADTKTNGTNQPFFVQYCKKVPGIRDCIANFTNTIKLCLNDDNKNNAHVIDDVINGLSDFVCSDNGYELSRFVAEEGVTCYEKRRNGLNSCLNAIANGLNSEIIPWMFLLTNPQECKKLDEFGSCLMNEFKLCRDTAIASTITDLINYIKPLTLCTELNYNKAETNNRLKRQNKMIGFEDDSVEKFFTRRCVDKRLGVFDQASFNNLQSSLREFSTAIENGYQMLHFDPRHFCVVQKEKLQKSSKRLGKDMESCFLKEGEEYLSKFIPKSVKEITKFLCDDQGKNIYKLFGPNGRLCLNAIANENGTYTNELQSCIKGKVFRPENNNILTKPELCSDFNTMKRCYTQFLSGLCPGNRDATELKDGFFKAATEPCSSSSHRFYLNYAYVFYMAMLPIAFKKMFFL